MTQCEVEVLQTCRDFCSEVYAWCALPNHYHVLVLTESIKGLRRALGQFHGRSSFNWNGEDGERGRQVWYNCFERPMKSLSFRIFLLSLLLTSASAGISQRPSDAASNARPKIVFIRIDDLRWDELGIAGQPGAFKALGEMKKEME